MAEITYGALVQVKDASGNLLPKRALTGIENGHDFKVVWACSEQEWSAAEVDGRAPKGAPWPAEDVMVVEAAPA